MSEKLGLAVAATAAGLLLAACSNAGEDRLLSVQGTGVVGGVAFLDLDGDRAPGSADAALTGVRVRLLVAGTHDTVASATSGPDGGFAFGRVPVGAYTVVVPGESSFGDSISVVRIDTSMVEIIPEDTVDISVAVSFPLVSLAEARVRPLGTKLFVRAVALNLVDTFGDTTLHVRDTSSALRLTNAPGTPLVTPGDSLRVLGRVAARDGQPVIDRAQVTIVALGSRPDPVVITTARAATADGGVLDAALIQVVDATISDSSTVNGEYVVTAADASGPVQVVFDPDATGLDPAAFVPGVVIDAIGLLVPDGSGGWRLKPRSTTTTPPDVVVK
jgi:hypothetical protein